MPLRKATASSVRDDREVGFIIKEAWRFAGHFAAVQRGILFFTALGTLLLVVSLM